MGRLHLVRVIARDAQHFTSGCIAGRSNSNLVVCKMNKTIGFQLAFYSLLLVGLSCLTNQLAPALAHTTLVTGIVGGVFCLAWAFCVVLGMKGRALPILTLIPICYVLLGQVIMVWTGQDVEGRRIAAFVIFVLFVLSLAMLMRIAYAGMSDGQPAAPAKSGKTSR